MPAVTRIGDADVPHCSGMTRAQGSPDVTVNGIAVSRKGDLKPSHLLPPAICPSHTAPIASGSSTVTVNGRGIDRVTAAAPVAAPLNITITNVVPDTAAVRAAIQAEIEDLILRESEPGRIILVSHIRQAISTAAGETDHTLTVPAADAAHAADRIAVPGEFTWQTS